jgi:ABC-2 type transport system ATP-binding protein
MLLIQDFEKKYGDTVILSIKTLRLDTGIYWIKGENGSGKSSLFRSISGILPCTGSVAFDDGITLHDNPVAFRRRINFSDAEPFYPAFLSGKDIFHFIAKSRNASIEQQEELIDSFGINAFYSMPCETYSSGMLKRLSLAISFLGETDVIVLDEPLITLDGAARNVLSSKIRSSMEKRKTIFLISSHEHLDENFLPISKTFTLYNKTLLTN